MFSLVRTFPARFTPRTIANLVILGSVVLTGCQQQPQITSYTVPKPEKIETPMKKPIPGLGRPLSPSEPPAAASDLKYDTPPGWKPAQGNAFSLIAFEVVDGEQRIEITVSAVGGGLLPNMNRWREQVGLPPFKSDEELQAAFTASEIDGKPAQFIELHAPEGAAKQDSILGYAIVDGDRSFYVKLRGASKLARREKDNLQAFAQSLRW